MPDLTLSQRVACWSDRSHWGGVFLLSHPHNNHKVLAMRSQSLSLITRPSIRIILREGRGSGWRRSHEGRQWLFRVTRGRRRPDARHLARIVLQPPQAPVRQRPNPPQRPRQRPHLGRLERAHLQPRHARHPDRLTRSRTTELQIRDRFAPRPRFTSAARPSRSTSMDLSRPNQAAGVGSSSRRAR
jgi:hypothetical protein